MSMLLPARACECLQQLFYAQESTRRPAWLAWVRFAARDSRSIRAAAGLPCKVEHNVL